MLSHIVTLIRSPVWPYFLSAGWLLVNLADSCSSITWLAAENGNKANLIPKSHKINIYKNEKPFIPYLALFDHAWTIRCNTYKIGQWKRNKLEGFINITAKKHTIWIQVSHCHILVQGWMNARLQNVTKWFRHNSRQSSSSRTYMYTITCII